MEFDLNNPKLSVANRVRRHFRFEVKRNETEAKSFSLRWEKSAFFACIASMRNLKIWSETKMKRNEKRRKRSKNCHHFCFETKQSKVRLFRFALKQNEKIGSETKNFWKRNKVKIRCTNFASVGSDKYAAQRSEKKNLTRACETDLVSLRFALKRTFFFWRNRRTLVAHEYMAGLNQAPEAHSCCTYI
jgi:hypothetical protein